MKKIILLSALFLVHSFVFAQTDTDESPDPIMEQNNQEAPQSQDSKIDYQALSEFLATWKAGQDDSKAAQKTIFFPVEGRRSFIRRHHLTQRLELSMMGGSDKDSDNSASDEAKNNNLPDKPVNFGLNIGYSLVFCPGRIMGDSLKINRLGFAYNIGAIAQFDSQDRYGTTCDLMAKIGFEAGFAHKRGIGIDFLVGTGKASGEYILYDPKALFGDEEIPDDLDENTPYTGWCFKYGFQIWLRSGLLNTQLKKTDVRLFARYIRSLDPDRNVDMTDIGIMNFWNEESWQFGVTFCYEF